MLHFWFILVMCSVRVLVLKILMHCEMEWNELFAQYTKSFFMHLQVSKMIMIMLNVRSASAGCWCRARRMRKWRGNRIGHIWIHIGNWDKFDLCTVCEVLHLNTVREVTTPPPLVIGSWIKISSHHTIQFHKFKYFFKLVFLLLTFSFSL